MEIFKYFGTYSEYFPLYIHLRDSKSGSADFKTSNLNPLILKKTQIRGQKFGSSLPSAFT